MALIQLEVDQIIIILFDIKLLKYICCMFSRIHIEQNFKSEVFLSGIINMCYGKC